jgi:SAM-dependent methyltransferase
MIVDSLRQSLDDHLDSWGLKRFTSDAHYFAWQRQALAADQLASLHRYVELKRQGTATDEVAFYDATAHPAILPVLYSQRYDYYQAIGPRVASRLEDAQTILDWGCGVGILTTFYARQYPGKTFVGVDRSPVSIARASEQAVQLGLKNVQFLCLDLTQQRLSGDYDVIVATHALVQAEQDPGLPSRDWRTFERAQDPPRQADFERRTGIGNCLDDICAALQPAGRLLIFEKTRQLARRIPLQRALAARGLFLVERPEPVRYALVEELVDDGPFYVLSKGAGPGVAWDESPEADEAPRFEFAGLDLRSEHAATPLYENHCPSAQLNWERLKDRKVSRETTREEPDGRQLHVEMGRATGLSYLYYANTFDQRQLVVMMTEQEPALEQYYAEILAQAR